MKKLLLTALAALALTSANAQGTAVEFTVTHGPGGPSDLVTRAIAKNLPSKNYTVVNRAGASGRIAMNHLLSNSAMLVATMSNIYVTNPLMFPDLEYDPDRDLEVIAVIGVMPNVLVCNNQHNFKTVNDIINSNKALTFGFSGYGGNEHIATMLLLNQLPGNHRPIPYSQGGAASLTDLMGGNLDCIFANYPLIASRISDTSRFTPIMSSTDLKLNIPVWEQVFREPYPVTSYLSLIIDRRLDPTIKSQIKADIAKALQRPGFDQELRQIGLFPVLRMDENTIKESMKVHQKLKSFILKIQLKLKP